MEVFKAAGKGMGLKVVDPVSKGQFIAEYVGEVREAVLHYSVGVVLAPTKRDAVRTSTRFWGACAVHKKWHPYAAGVVIFFGVCPCSRFTAELT